MPGLYCPTSWTPLPLTDSCVRAYAKGPCLSLRARLTYHNPQPQPVDGETWFGYGEVANARRSSTTVCLLLLAGVFVYPLAEAEVVSGFEAEAAGRRVSFQLQSRRRLQAACCRALGPGLGTSTPRRCAQGKLRARACALECQPQLRFLYPRASRQPSFFVQTLILFSIH